eukprot:g19198.t1
MAVEWGGSGIERLPFGRSDRPEPNEPKAFRTARSVRSDTGFAFQARFRRVRSEALHVRQPGSSWFFRCIFRRKIFKVLNDPSSSCAARWASYLLTSVILLTAVTMICESMPEFRFVPDACQEILTVENCRPRPADAFYYIEFVSIIIFTIDYILRVCTANSMSPAELGVQYVGEEGVPFYLEMAGLQLGSSAVIRVLRLIRIFRLLKSPKMRNCVDMIVDIVKDALPGILSVFSLTFLVCVLLASCIYFAEGTTYSVEHFQEMYPYGVYIRPTKLGYEMEVTPFRSIFHSFWWFFTTATTVGYGDDFPTTAMGHVIAVFTFYAGVVLVAIMLTIVGGAFQNHYPRFKRWMEQENRRQAMEAEKEVVIGKTRRSARELCKIVSLRCILDPRSLQMPLQRVPVGKQVPTPNKLLCVAWLSRDELVVGGSDGKVIRISLASSSDNAL